MPSATQAPYFTMTGDIRPNSAASVTSSSGSYHAEQPPHHHVLSPDAATSDENRNKVVGACSSCRRSKVKCEHEGTAPCKRCKNGGYECTFKPREMGSAFLQDEWRIKTDETLSKLVMAMNALVQQEDAALPARKRRAVEGGFAEDAGARFGPPVASGLTVGNATPTRGQGVMRAANGAHMVASQGAGSGAGYHAGMSAYHHPNAGPSSFAPSLSLNLGTNSRRASLVAGLDHSMDAFASSPSANGITNISQLQPHVTKADATHPIRSSVRARGSLPIPHASTKTNAMKGSSTPKPGLLARTSRYRYPDADLGSNDPRLDAIRLGILSSHEARSLFSLYAKAIEPFGFGFPDFPASADLTPVLLSAITSVSSLHTPSLDLRARQLRLRTDVLDRTLPYAPSTAGDEFNPESGIGTEEVVGACIWSSHEGSSDAWNVARAARWWSEKYSYETGPHAGLTVGEMVAILPPVRHVNLQDRVRVWLTAFIAELHQCEIHSKEPIMELIDPTQYGQALIQEQNPSCTPESTGKAGTTKQDAGLVFFSRVAYLVSRAKTTKVSPEELLAVAEEITASWCATRALLSTEPEKKDTYDHMIDLHHSLARASLLIRACSLHEERCSAEGATHKDVGMATAALVSCSRICQSVCLDSIRLLLSPGAALVGNLAALPSIYHFWIGGCLMFLLELCSPDRLHYRLGLLAGGQLDEILRTVEAFMGHYLEELSACSTPILVEELQQGEGEEGSFEVVKHPATEAALVVADLLACVRATA
ncbi:uncharacterized protein UTRI_01902_B [Ustilago trichophora]|uniref:Zn(2)-C6 fungal-type domain-containing protein n=1 Tax=Ustilago trichophora TaxID=86804 RepID=A0A5C3DUE7_9BASI|nr:uncharacterized protein UTRI_01902_B [Ustilago trichophora]